MENTRRKNLLSWLFIYVLLDVCHSLEINLKKKKEIKFRMPLYIPSG
jgi:hypothetical protein